MKLQFLFLNLCPNLSHLCHLSPMIEGLHRHPKSKRLLCLADADMLAWFTNEELGTLTSAKSDFTSCVPSPPLTQDRPTNTQTDRDRQTDRWTDGRTDVQTDRHILNTPTQTLLHASNMQVGSSTVYEQRRQSYYEACAVGNLRTSSQLPAPAGASNSKSSVPSRPAAYNVNQKVH